MEGPAPILLTLDAAALALAVSPRTVRRLLDAGQLSAVRIGRAVRVRAADVCALVDRASPPSDNPPGVAVPENDTCHENRNDRKTGSTSGRTRRTGGPVTQPNAGAQLAAVLGFPSPTTRRD